MPRRRPPPARGAGSADLAARLAGLVRAVPDFPRPGITFQDVTTLFANSTAFRQAIDAMASAHSDAAVEVVAGIESRGFALAAPLAYVLGAAFVPIRKQGRLPADTLSVAYSLEYGEAVLEIHADAFAPGCRVLLVDDLLATGGTAAAAIHLVESLGGVVSGLAFLIELSDLGGATALQGHPHTSLITL